ncbi:MAG: preprotein translocase subunit SecA, partial [Verrucomicrobia bacterium]|nr:preprotein translocase subunit SecA [Verrucomicrobiota bacterium]
MFNWIIKKIIGTKNQRTVRKLQPTVAEINRIEALLQNEPEEALQERTRKWQAQFRAFHTPPFLGGVSLRIASEAEVDACLEAVEKYFTALKPHFPALENDYLASAAWNGAALDDKKARIDRSREAWNALQPDFAAIESKMLNDILPEAYAVVKNAARRMCGREIMVCDQPLGWNMVHFDVQLVGGVALHRGMIAEMATGEGKTLVGTLPVYLNALTGRGVHVITVNDYLARRDSEWMGSLYKYLGLTVGCIQNDQPSHLRRDQYQADITYGTNSEFGFDYLRDNGMASSKEQQVQRGHYFAIVDEVDSVLIDEARTPLIISGPVMAAESNHQYERYKPLVDQLVRRQNTLCNRLITEAKEAAAAGELEQAGLKLFQVQMGQPKNRALTRCMEEPDLRRAMEKAELSLYADTQKVEFFRLKEELYYFIEEKSHDADLTEMGRNFLSPDEPDAFVLPDIATVYSEIDGDMTLSEEARTRKKTEMQDRLSHQGQRIHQISQLLRAFCLYEKDVEYVVEENKVVIVDAQTGRKMAGRRWSDGLHQAVEAKEGVNIQQENQTLASITFQNYFRLYKKLAGMTGTADTEAFEFQNIYKLEVVVIPTNRAMVRKDQGDQVFISAKEKFDAVIAEIAQANQREQPVLVGTASIETSELLAKLLTDKGIKHEVLNAKQHEREAEIIANAGRPNTVTIATNMAGRGTDIVLGGSLEAELHAVPEDDAATRARLKADWQVRHDAVKASGGLYVIGSERHESRRIDNQLRGRSGRQGDPGATRFYLSLDDTLMRIFTPPSMRAMLTRLGMQPGEAIEHRWVSRAIETAQRKVEAHNFDIRKNLLEYDNVANDQRKAVYELRDELMGAEKVTALVDDIRPDVMTGIVDAYIPPQTIESMWKLEQLEA